MLHLRRVHHGVVGRAGPDVGDCRVESVCAYLGKGGALPWTRLTDFLAPSHGMYRGSHPLPGWSTTELDLETS